METNQCQRCGHQWMGRKVNPATGEIAQPRKCPGCGSPYWNRPRMSDDERAKAQSSRMRRAWANRGRSR